jgi:hypothetical protein
MPADGRNSMGPEVADWERRLWLLSCASPPVDCGWVDDGPMSGDIMEPLM